MSAPCGGVFCAASEVTGVGVRSPLESLPKSLCKTHEKDALGHEYRYGRYHRFYLLRNEV